MLDEYEISFKWNFILKKYLWKDNISDQATIEDGIGLDRFGSLPDWSNLAQHY